MTRAPSVFTDDVLELLDVGQAAERVHGELKVLGVRRRGLTELAGGHLDVLLANGGHHVAGGEAARLEALRIEPHAHAVLPRAEDVHVADAVDASSARHGDGAWRSC